MKLYIAIKNISNFEAIDSLLSGNSDIVHIAKKNHYKPLGLNQLNDFYRVTKT